MVSAWKELAIMERGTMVELTNGDVAEFIRLKRKNFIGNMKGASYDIPVTMFKSIVSVPEKKDKTSDIDSLKEGDMFYIEHNGDAKLFQFVSIVNNKLVGKNPITKSNVRIDKSLFFAKI